MALPKWTDERTQQLVDFVGGESPISQDTVALAATELETSVRSVSSKLRKMGHDVELASSVSNRTFSEEQEATLSNFVSDNSGAYTYADIASSFEGGAFSAKSIQGKILSMELTGHVKPAEKPESVRTYSPEEEATFTTMVNGGSFVEEIAEALESIGARIMLDDRRDASPGVKFKDAELIGIPTIVVVGKGLADGTIEVRDRKSGERSDIPVDEVVGYLAALLD